MLAKSVTEYEKLTPPLNYISQLHLHRVSTFLLVSTVLSL